MLGLRLLWRNWHSGELRILSAALVLAVTVVSAVSILTQRLESALERQGQTLLAANRVIQSSQPIPLAWVGMAQQRGLQTALTAEFASMVFAGDNMHLSSVKAVGPGYPLLGEVKLSEVPFATEARHMQVAPGIPELGEVWVDSRLLPMLDMQLRDSLEVGDLSLTAAQLVIEEPDRGSGFSSMGARVMMNLADVQATGVVQPGSRVKYRLLLAGAESDLEAFLNDVEPQLTRHQRLVDLKNSQRRLTRSLETGRKFLLLTAMMSVLLAGVAIAMAGRAFAARQVDQVALLKSLGGTARRVTQIYAIQILVLGLVTTLIGVALGELLQRLVAMSLADIFRLTLGAAHWQAYIPGAVSGCVCLVCFTLPPLWHLPGIPPLKILRRELDTNSVAVYTQVALGILALLGLVAMFSADWQLVAITALSLTLLVVVGFGCGLLLLRLVNRLARLGPSWRLAMGAMKRSRQLSIVQIVVFGLAVMLLMTLAGLKTSLISDWQRQLPPDTPNHFLMNISAPEIEPVQEILAGHSIAMRPFYPMVRARLSHINDTPVSERPELESNVLRREVNLSWARQMGEDNRLLQGVWWDQLQPAENVHLVSVEAEVAGELHLRLGDRLRFSVGGLPLLAEVSSVRSVQWDSMNPNFYFLLSPGALDGFAPMALTSVHLSAADKPVVNDILRAFPTVVVIEMDRVIAQIQSIVDQVSIGVSWMLWLVLIAGFLVMWAAVNSSLDERRHEVALLRALGSSRSRILGSLWVEFSLLGLCAGLMAMAGAELMLWGVQTQILELKPRPHVGLWLLGLLLAWLVIGGMGVLACRRVVTTSPAQTLQAYR